MCTRLACSNPVYSRFQSCLKWIRVGLTAEPVIRWLRSQLLLIPISNAVPADADDNSSPQQLLTFQPAAEPGFFATYIPALADDPSRLQLNPVSFHHVPAFVDDPSSPQLDQLYSPPPFLPSLTIFLACSRTLFLSTTFLPLLMTYPARSWTSFLSHIRSWIRWRSF